ncbi:Urea amidolyase, partial [Dissostichus eleginoides]
RVTNSAEPYLSPVSKYRGDHRRQAEGSVKCREVSRARGDFDSPETQIVHIHLGSALCVFASLLLCASHFRHS